MEPKEPDWSNLPFETAVAAVGFSFSLALAVLAFLGSRWFARRRERHREEARLLRELKVNLRQWRNDHVDIGDPKSTKQDRALFITMFWAKIVDYESDLGDRHLVAWLRKVRERMTAYLEWLEGHPHEDRLVDHAVVGAYYEALISFVGELNAYKARRWPHRPPALDTDFLPDWEKVEREAKAANAYPTGGRGIMFRVLLLVAQGRLFLLETFQRLRGR